METALSNNYRHAKALIYIGKARSIHITNQTPCSHTFPCTIPYVTAKLIYYHFVSTPQKNSKIHKVWVCNIKGDFFYLFSFCFLYVTLILCFGSLLLFGTENPKLVTTRSYCASSSTFPTWPGRVPMDIMHTYQ